METLTWIGLLDKHMVKVCVTVVLVVLLWALSRPTLNTRVEIPKQPRA